MIKIVDLEKTYEASGGRRVTALRGVNLHVAKGEIFGIIGESGAGKSTLVRCMNMLERPTSGSVIVDGEDLTKMNDSKLRAARKDISMIFQHFNLLSSRTVFDNVAFPLELVGKKKAEIEAKVLPLLELVGLADKRNQYPSQLSGGQKQRVGIARALASDPKVLLCDEATSALDPQTTKSILNLLKDINEKLKLTIVLITHEMHVIKEICHRVAVIGGGNIVEEGPVAEVFMHPKQQITREFISTVISHELPPFLADVDLSDTPVEGSNLVLRLSFVGDSADEPIMSRLIRDIGVDVNIIYGNIDQIQSTAYGTLIIELSGDDEDIQASLDYLHQQKLGVEVIGYVIA